MLRQLLFLTLLFIIRLFAGNTNAAFVPMQYVIIVKPAGNTLDSWKTQTLDSIFGQAFSNFRGICLSENAESHAFLEKYRVINHLQSRLSISSNSSMPSVIGSECCEDEAIIIREDDEWFADQDSLENLIRGNA